jgi:uncharacterized membrane protein YccC
MIQTTIIGLVIAAFLGFAVWALDQFRDHVVAARDAEYKAATELVNVDLNAYATAEARLAALRTAALARALEQAKAAGGQCTLEADEADALNAIRRAH